MTMTLVAIVAIAAACGLAVVVWTQYRDAQQRSTARVAALAAAIDGPFDLPLAAGGMLDSFDAERPALASSWQPPAMPSRRGWIMAAGAVPLLLILVALFATRGARPASSPQAARQPQSLELLAMHHDRAGDRLTVTGTVRVRGRDTAPVTAVVTGRDGDGHIVASAHAPLDDATLDLSGESSFQVSVPGHDVRRYQVRFETPLGPLTHVDRRAERTAAPVTP